MSILHMVQNTPNTVFKSVFLSAALLAVVGVTGCASKPQVNNSARYAVAPDFYTVRSGDTLSGIAARYGLNYQSIADMNDIAAPYRIFVGQSLRLKNTGAKRSISTQPITQTAPIQRQSIALPSTTTTVTQTPKAPTTPTVVTPKTPVATATTQQNLRWVRPSQGTVLQGFDVAKDVKGIRFGGKIGDPVLAAAQGQVIYAADGLKEYGQLVLIKHVDGYITAYAHNNKLLVSSGQQVTAGQKIAEMGNSGTNQTMLEFQVRLDGKPVNPNSVIRID
ncbi:peptidoglycan DD-metalloendopeptidase family protein [uncultured Acinetobacter sp.]|uniref:peptidoglycan DD-metalloendopeptidase family protein n=1 Tax=uncultured Acinetobacter sp. TaxID=165433 RepID=UPI0026191E93|nr:peptidoglycan DD-metalloendopeptidase family protein [uncultured Acinetobacter sp.]